MTASWSTLFPLQEPPLSQLPGAAGYTPFAVEQDAEFMTSHFANYSVVYLDFSGLYGRDFPVEEMLKEVRNVIYEELVRHNHLLSYLEKKCATGRGGQLELDLG